MTYDRSKDDHRDKLVLFTVSSKKCLVSGKAAPSDCVILKHYCGLSIGTKIRQNLHRVHVATDSDLHDFGGLGPFLKDFGLQSDQLLRHK